MIVLSVGVVAMAGSSAMVTRMITRGKISTRGAQVAERRLETLRQTALNTTPECTSLSGGSATQTGGITESWAVSGSGKTRTVQVIVSYPFVGRTHTDTVTTLFLCN